MNVPTAAGDVFCRYYNIINGNQKVMKFRKSGFPLQENLYNGLCY